MTVAFKRSRRLSIIFIIMMSIMMVIEATIKVIIVIMIITFMMIKFMKIKIMMIKFIMIKFMKNEDHPDHLELWSARSGGWH